VKPAGIKWRLRELITTRHPRAAAAYRRTVKAWFGRHDRVIRLRSWLEEGSELRRELGVSEYRFDADGPWVRDAAGIEWKIVPGRFLSAGGHEYGVCFDAAEIDWISARIAPAGTFVDVGAHVGGYVIPIALRVPGCTIVAFEPVSSTRELLQSNLERNHLDGRVLTIPRAASDSPGEVVMTTIEGGENRVVPRGSAGQDLEVVASVRLDDELAGKVDKVDVIKLDLEGGELPALQGAEGILERDRPDLIVEVDERYPPRFGYEPRELFEWLEDLGYRWERFVAGKLRPPVTVAQALREGNNFLFRSRQADEVRAA
jgi:FkbM family methyltransferase